MQPRQASSAAAELQQHEVRALLGAAGLAAFLEVGLLSALRSNRRQFYVCPDPRCRSVVDVGAAASCATVACPACGLLGCARCEQPAHRGGRGKFEAPLVECSIGCVRWPWRAPGAEQHTRKVLLFPMRHRRLDRAGWPDQPDQPGGLQAAGVLREPELAPRPPALPCPPCRPLQRVAAGSRAGGVRPPPEDAHLPRLPLPAAARRARLQPAQVRPPRSSCGLPLVPSCARVQLWWHIACARAQPRRRMWSARARPGSSAGADRPVFMRACTEFFRSHQP